MNNKDFKLLGRRFSVRMSEMPFQIKDKRMNVLFEKGLVKKVTVEDGHVPPMKITGYILTLRGHMDYCEECGKREPSD